MKRLAEWLDNKRIAFTAWWFNLRAVDVHLVRSCGHIERGKLLPEWIDRRRSTPCPECEFWDAMSAHKVETACSQ